MGVVVVYGDDRRSFLSDVRGATLLLAARVGWAALAEQAGAATPAPSQSLRVMLQPPSRRAVRMG